MQRFQIKKKIKNQHHLLCVQLVLIAVQLTPSMFIVKFKLWKDIDLNLRMPEPMLSLRGPQLNIAWVHFKPQII